MNKLCQECRYNSELDFLWCERMHKIIRRENCVLKKQDNMKDLFKSWKFWTVFGIVAAIIIAAVVCHLVQPTVSYAWLEIVAAFTFVLGAVSGGLIDNYLNKKKEK